MIIRLSLILLSLFSSLALYAHPSAHTYTTDQVRLLAEFGDEAGHGNSSIGEYPTTALELGASFRLTNPIFDTFHGTTGRSGIFLGDLRRHKFGSLCYSNSCFSKKGSQEKQVIVTFPGTQTLPDLSSDTNSKKVTLYDCGETSVRGTHFDRMNVALLSDELSKQVEIHTGFGEVYLSCKRDLVAKIKKIKREQKIADNALRLIIAGHSLGGAVATIAALDLWYTFFNGVTNRPDNPVSVVTFGAPPVFKGPTKRGWSGVKCFDQSTWDKTALTLWERTVGHDNIVRLVDIDDPVPAILSNSYQELRTNYYHQLGTECPLNTKPSGLVESIIPYTLYGASNSTRATSVLFNRSKHYVSHYIKHLEREEFKLPIQSA